MPNSPDTHKGLPLYWFKTAKSWQAWLAKNFNSEQGVWLKFAKKDSGQVSLTYEEAREVAIAYGWIDGLKNRLDAEFYLIKLTRRRPKSKWSKINRDIAESLIKHKKMHPSGREQVDAARADGRWDAAYDSPATIEVPDDLAKLLKSNHTARANFEQLNRTNRYALLIRLQTAPQQAIRAKRLAETLKKLEAGEAFNSKPTPPQASPAKLAVLLRGVNVSGKNKIVMSELRQALSGPKLGDVSTYIQSGNLICTTHMTPEAVAITTQQTIMKRWGYDVKAFTLSHAQLESIVKKNPFANLDLSKVSVTLLSSSTSKATIQTRIAPFASGEEQVAGRGNVLYLYCPDGSARTKMNNKLIETKLACSATSRNWNTVTKLLALLA